MDRPIFLKIDINVSKFVLAGYIPVRRVAGVLAPALGAWSPGFRLSAPLTGKTPAALEQLHHAVGWPEKSEFVCVCFVCESSPQSLKLQILSLLSVLGSL